MFAEELDHYRRDTACYCFRFLMNFYLKQLVEKLDLKRRKSVLSKEGSEKLVLVSDITHTLPLYEISKK